MSFFFVLSMKKPAHVYVRAHFVGKMLRIRRSATLFPTLFVEFCTDLHQREAQEVLAFPEVGFEAVFIIKRGGSIRARAAVRPQLKAIAGLLTLGIPEEIMSTDIVPKTFGVRVFPVEKPIGTQYICG